MERSKQFQQEIINNSIADRWELGAYLHDNLSQVLASIKIMAHELQKKKPYDNREEIEERLEMIKGLIDKEMDGIRDLSHDIIPIDVEEEGVSHAFTLLMRQTQKIHKVKCTLETDEIIDNINNRKLSTNLYHITQEAIKNAVNHGQAKHIKIGINADEEFLYLKIWDDGIGFSSEDQKKKGMGLNIMQHRVELLGGSLAIDSLSDESKYSTLISCQFPIETIKSEKKKDQPKKDQS